MYLECPANFVPSYQKNTCVFDNVENCIEYNDDGNCRTCTEGKELFLNFCFNHIENCEIYDLELSNELSPDPVNACAVCAEGYGITFDYLECKEHVHLCKYHSHQDNECEVCLNKRALNVNRKCDYHCEGTLADQKVCATIGDIFPQQVPGTLPDNIRQAEGRVEVTFDWGNVWGTVCDDSFDTYEAQATCEEMGFYNGEILENRRTVSGIVSS